MKDDGLLNGKTIVFSGIEIVDRVVPYIVRQGGLVRTQVSGVTDILVVKSLFIESAKLRAAQKYGTKEIILFDDFVKKYVPEFAGLAIDQMSVRRGPKVYVLQHNVAMSIRTVQKALGVLIKHGDIVKSSYGTVYFVVYDRKLGKKRLIKNAASNHSLSVPVIVSAGLSDAFAAYKDFADVKSVQIGGNDAYVKSLLGRNPSDYFKKHVKLCFVREKLDSWKLQVQFMKYVRTFDVQSVTGSQILEFVASMERKKNTTDKRGVGVVPIMDVKDDTKCIVM